MRPAWVALALTLAAACGGTGPSDDGPVFSGSIFFARSASGDSYATSPWELIFGSAERLIPVDLS